MSCPDIEKIAQDELDEPTRAHLAECAPCRERLAKLEKLLAFPAMAVPPPDVLPRLLAKIDEQVAREVAARPRRGGGGQRRIVAAAVMFAVIGASLVLMLGDGETRAKERRLEAVVVESEWRALGYANEREFLADAPGGVK
ncbi:MAG: hypothetical protein ACAI25_13795 [Planctomycetota bacterium]